MNGSGNDYDFESDTEDNDYTKMIIITIRK